MRITCVGIAASLSLLIVVSPVRSQTAVMSPDTPQGPKDDKLQAWSSFIPPVVIPYDFEKGSAGLPAQVNRRSLDGKTSI